VPSLFSFYKFPEAIRCSIYTTNLIERSNKSLKHTTKIKEQFPDEASMDRYVCCYYSDSNRTYANRIQRGFQKVSAELLQMFDSDSQETEEQVLAEAI
jgi:putative transposase